VAKQKREPNVGPSGMNKKVKGEYKDSFFSSLVSSAGQDHHFNPTSPRKKTARALKLAPQAPEKLQLALKGTPDPRAVAAGFTGKNATFQIRAEADGASRVSGTRGEVDVGSKARKTGATRSQGFISTGERPQGKGTNSYLLAWNS